MLLHRYILIRIDKKYVQGDPGQHQDLRRQALWQRRQASTKPWDNILVCWQEWWWSRIYVHLYGQLKLWTCTPKCYAPGSLTRIRSQPWWESFSKSLWGSTRQWAVETSANMTAGCSKSTCTNTIIVFEGTFKSARSRKIVFRVTEDGEVFVLEVNSFCSFGPLSLVTKIYFTIRYNLSSIGHI